MANRGDYGQFLPTTHVYEADDIQELDVNSTQFKDFLVKLYMDTNKQSIAINGKDTGTYDTEEFVTGQTFFPPTNQTSSSPNSAPKRQVFRKVINFGALPNTTTKTVRHDIEMNATFTFTNIRGTATDPVNSVFIPLPYSSLVLADNIELSLDKTNVIITTGSNWSSYLTTYVVVEYLKS